MTEAIREGDIPGVQLRRRQALALAPEEAWRWLVEPALLARWLADVVEVELGVRGGLRLAGHDEVAGGAARRERGTTVEYAPPQLWVLAFERLDAGWGAATRLALEVHGRAGGAELDVLQSGFQRLPLSLCLTVWESYRARWRAALGRLAQATSAK
jgi:uncharacterized protein YndB with AHSA1/START domain